MQLPEQLLPRLLRYVLRPPLAQDRLAVLLDHRVRLTLNRAVLDCIRAVHSLGQALKLLRRGRDVAADVVRVELAVQSGEMTRKDVPRSLMDWLARLEVESLVGDAARRPVEIARDNLTRAPSLAIRLLKRHLRGAPDDFEAIFLKGKTAAVMILDHGPSFDPLLYYDPVTELKDSLERQLALRPTAESAPAARKLLDIIERKVASASRPGSGHTR